MMVRSLCFVALAAALVQLPMPIGHWTTAAQAADGVPMQEAGSAGEHVDKGAMNKGAHMKKSSKRRKK